MIKYTDLKQFQYDFEQKIIDYFKELEEAIDESDLSDKTRNYLVELMYKDENRVFGFVEERIDRFCEILGDKENE